MSLATDTMRPATPYLDPKPGSEQRAASEPGFQIIRRNGGVTPFDASKISVALTKACLAVEGSSAAASRRIHDIVADLTAQIVAGLTRRTEAGRTFHIEDVEDQVELALMRSEHHKVARAYVLYREERAQERVRAKTEAKAVTAAPTPRLAAWPEDDLLPARAVGDPCRKIGAEGHRRQAQ